MAKDITIKSPDGSTIYYPKTVSDLVFDNDSGITIKEITDLLQPQTVQQKSTRTIKGSMNAEDFGFDYPLPIGTEVDIVESSASFNRIKINGKDAVFVMNGNIQSGFWGKRISTEPINAITVQNYGDNITVNVAYNRATIQIKEDISEIGSDVGSVVDLTTNDKSCVVNAINEINAGLPPTTDVEIVEIDHKSVGTNMTTISLQYPIKKGEKYTISEDVSGTYIRVSIIDEDNNEVQVCSKTGGNWDGSLFSGEKIAPFDIVKIRYGCYSTISLKHSVKKFIYDTEVERIDQTIGDLEELQTVDKTSVVHATNEIVNALPEMEQVTKYLLYQVDGNTSGKVYVLDEPIKANQHYFIQQHNAQYSIYSAIYSDGSETIILRVVGGSVTNGHWGEQVANNKIVSIKIQSYSGNIHTIYINKKQLKLGEELNLKAPNRWFGKKWLLIGDSISTEGASWATSGYGSYISKSLGLLKTNVAVGGQTMGAIYENQVKKISGNFDLITIMGGTNDAGYNSGMDALRTNTINIINYIREHYPKTVFFFITPIHRCNIGADGTADNLTERTRQYTEVLKNTCKEYCVPCVDIFDCIAPEIASQRSLFFCGEHISGQAEDGTHPNDLGHALFIAPIVEDAILKHAPFYFCK